MGDNSEKSGIFTSVCCGAGATWPSALSKAYSEFVERKAFEKSDFTSTTGFAAFPYIFSKKLAIKKARRLAYLEMLERYAWQVWFANMNVSYRRPSSILEENSIFFEEFKKDIEILNIYKLLPSLADETVSMVILYAETPDGLICASSAKETELAAERNALKELYMHAVGLHRLKKDKILPTTYYEKRVFWISGQKKRLESRLKCTGSEKIVVPFPIKYENIPTEYSDAYVVQRCSFEGYDREFITQDNEMYV